MFFLIQNRLFQFNIPGKSSTIVSIPTYFYTNQTSVSIQELLVGPLTQNDHRIINYIIDEAEHQRFLLPPSTLPYELKEPNINPSMGQSKVVHQILRNMRNGFFVECGGLDGEIRSNTLDFEKNYNWQGLLIEADPTNFDLLVKKNRKAWMSNTCLATKPYPHQVIFEKAFNKGKISKEFDIQKEIPNQGINEVKAQCFPLYTLLSVLNVSTVDYFSLDVEGLEYAVLKTIPFEKVIIKVLSVEYVLQLQIIFKLNLWHTSFYRCRIQCRILNIYALCFIKSSKLIIKISSRHSFGVYTELKNDTVACKGGLIYLSKRTNFARRQSSLI